MLSANENVVLIVGKVEVKDSTKELLSVRVIEYEGEVDGVAGPTVKERVCCGDFVRLPVKEKDHWSVSEVVDVNEKDETYVPVIVPVGIGTNELENVSDGVCSSVEDIVANTLTVVVFVVVIVVVSESETSIVLE